MAILLQVSFDSFHSPHNTIRELQKLADAEKSSTTQVKHKHWNQKAAKETSDCSS